MGRDRDSKATWTRRQVLRGLGGLAAGATIGLRPGLALAGRGALSGASIQPAAPNRGDLLQGIHAVAQKSIAAGEQIDFRVSSDVAYRLRIMRLGWNVDGPGQHDWTVHDFGFQTASRRSVHPGSYVHVERSLPQSAVGSMSLEAWVRPFGDAWQGVVTQYDYPDHAGVGLFVAPGDRVAFYFGDGGRFRSSGLVSSSARLRHGGWNHLVATFDRGVARLYANGVEVAARAGLPALTVPADAPLRLGAYGERGETMGFLTGDLAMPVVYDRALQPWEIAARARAIPPDAPSGAGVVGCWPLDEEGGADVRDVSGCARDGLIVNRGTWMVGGPGFDARGVGRFDRSYDPDRDVTRGHSLRLSPDDLYETDWPVRHSFRVPADLPPGLYVGRFDHGSGATYDSTFVVRAATALPKARVLVLCASNTWLAYNDRPFANGGTTAAAYSFYQRHDHGGLPGYQVGVDLPWPSADPYLVYYTEDRYSHGVRAERYLHVWLEKNGYDYDVASDADLHADPSLLADYPVVVVAGHSEYWSRTAYDALEAHLGRGGNVISASGNTIFWRVTLEDGVLECRKLPTSVGGFSDDLVGELYHTHDHARGGLAREADMPAWSVVGLECIGYNGEKTAYTVTDDTHPFFHTPERVGRVNTQKLGGDVAVWHEYDVTRAQIPGAPAAPPGQTPPRVLAQATMNADHFDYQAGWRSGHHVASEIIDWQRNDGGRVFAVGSIAAGRALADDDAMSTLFRNALDQMGIVFRLNALALDRRGRFQNKWFDGRAWGPSAGGWQDLGGTFTHPPTGVAWGPNRLAIMAIASTGHLLYRYWNGSAWSGWSDFGGDFQGRPAAVAWGRNRLEIFCRGTDDHLYQKSWTGSHWTGWRSLGADACSSPTAIAWEGDQLAVAVVGGAGNVNYRYWTAARDWQPVGGWQDMGGSRFAHAPTLVRWGGNRIDLYAVDDVGLVSVRRWDGARWSPTGTGWQPLGGGFTGPVAVGVREGDALSLFGIGRTGRLSAKWWSATSGWGPSLLGWQDMGGALQGEPAVATWRGRFLSVMATGLDGRLHQREWDGRGWSGWQSLGGDLQPSPAVFRWIEG